MLVSLITAHLKKKIRTLYGEFEAASQDTTCNVPAAAIFICFQMSNELTRSTHHQSPEKKKTN